MPKDYRKIYIIKLQEGNTPNILHEQKYSADIGWRSGKQNATLHTKAVRGSGRTYRTPTHHAGISAPPAGKCNIRGNFVPMA